MSTEGGGGEGHGEVINGVFDTCTELALLLPFYSLKQEEDIFRTKHVSFS